MFKYLCISFAFLLGFAFFESSILSNIFFLPVVPDFLLICVLFWSFSYGKKIGVITGFFSGLLMDFLTGSPFGLNSLLRTIIGYSCGFFSKTFNSRGIIMPILIVFLGTIYKLILLGIIAFFYPNVAIGYNILSHSFLYELLSNSILSFLVFKFLSIFNFVDKNNLKSL